MAKKKNDKLALSLLATGLGFLVGAVIIVATGKNPLVMLNAMVFGTTGLNIGKGIYNARQFGEFLIQAMPITLTGLSVGFAFRTGLFNIGAEGQVLVGGLAATVTALTVSAPAPIHVVLVIGSGMLAGAIWGAVPGYLKARFNVHEVVVTIMMNYIGLHLNNHVIRNVIGTTDGVKTVLFPQTAMLSSDFLARATNGSRLNWAIIPVAFSIVLYWFLIEKTTFGFGLRAVGFNKEGARYAGMKVERNVVASMAIAGAFAGLAGAIMAVGTFGFGRTLPAAEGYGFDGIAVALVGGNAALGIFFSGLLFGMLKNAAPLMQSAGIPKEIGLIIQASIVVFVAMKLGLEKLLVLMGRKSREPVEGSAV